MTPTTYTPEELRAIWAEARHEAHRAATKYYKEVLNNRDQYACGFSGVDIMGIKGNTKLGRNLKAAGLSRKLWNPSGLGVQNVDTLLAGSDAAALVFERYGFTVYAWSKLD